MGKGRKRRESQALGVVEFFEQVGTTFLHSQVGLLKGSAFGVDLGVRTEVEWGGRSCSWPVWFLISFPAAQMDKERTVRKVGRSSLLDHFPPLDKGGGG